jgi:hypothetical protein
VADHLHRRISPHSRRELGFSSHRDSFSNDESD